jgi:hypothetical protein
MLDFNLKSYEILLAHAKSRGYRFINFADVSIEQQKDSKDSMGRGRLLLRHDVDVDLAAAKEMAQLEFSLGIKSTYFLMWRSPCYNLMSRANQSFAESILAMGHHVGLHYDQGFDALRNFETEETAKAVKQQANWLETLLGCSVHAVSFHQPSAALLQAGVNCAGRINTYDREKLKDFRYISDSNRIFPLWELIESKYKLNQVSSAKNSLDTALADCFPEDIQLLVHPMWWVYGAKSTEAVWDRAILNNIDIMQNQLIETERAYGLRRKVDIQ